MMHSSLPSRNQTPGITVVLSARGFLSTDRPAPSLPPGPTDQDNKGHVDNSSQSGARIPAKLQLLNRNQGAYAIRILQNTDKSRASAVVSTDISEVSVLRHTPQEFEFVLDSDGSRHLMSFSNLRDGQQFLAIFTAAKSQEQISMANSAKRGMAAMAGMAAKFPGMPRLLGGGGGGAATDRLEQKEEETGPSPPDDARQTEDMDVHTLVENFKKSIAAGDAAGAVVWAKHLANLQPKLSILVETVGGPPTRSEEISVQVQVEDRQASKLKLRMTVPSNITIAGLKKMTLLKYDLPVKVQNWLIDGKIMKDSDSLAANNITSSGATLYLYLTNAEKEQLSRQDLETEKHALMEQNKNQRPNASRDAHLRQWPPGGEVPRRRAPQERVIPPSWGEAAPGRSIPSSGPHSLRTSGEGQRLSSTGTGSRLPPGGSFDPLPQLDSVPEPSRPAERKLPSALDVGWSCPSCTLVNPPLIPGCQVCTMDRPSGYQVPDRASYALDPSETLFVQNAEENEKALKQMEEEHKLRNYQDLLQIDERDLVPNTEPFECPVCFMEVEVGEGVVLRECLHTFCRGCLEEHIKVSTDAMVKCPGMDDGIPCNQPILEREIKALLSEDAYRKFHERSLRAAESSAANSFHCKTANCAGFCFYDDDNNFFTCPLCKRTNCLTCKAIHEGIDCKQYQEELRIRAQNDVAAKQTRDTLQMLVQTGEAMHCPHCNIIVQKKGGCDWLRCSVCQTEICWITKQARWGPQGAGDNSGGCRCRVNGQKCHPNCHNCH